MLQSMGDKESDMTDRLNKNKKVQLLEVRSVSEAYHNNLTLDEDWIHYDLQSSDSAYWGKKKHIR